MNAVGKLGSYISRSVNTVSGPFHPFGGAVDIIVVEQEDGSFKSSPWYVRFGKFQGVLKSKEKVVSINVNGVDADFNMYLDHKGEAYFLREEEEEEGEEGICLFSPSSSGEETDEQQGNPRHVKSRSWNCDSNFPDSVAKIEVTNRKSITRTNSRRSRIFGFVFGKKSVDGNKLAGEENDTDVARTESLERAEIAADLLEVKWSTSFASSSSKRDKSLRTCTQDVSKDDTNKDLKENDGQSNENSGTNQNLVDGLKTNGEASPAGSGKNPNSPSSFQKVENSVEGTGMEISCSFSEDGAGGSQSAVCHETKHSQTIAWDDSRKQTNLYREVCVQSEVLHIKTDSAPEEMSERGNDTSNGRIDVQEFFIERNHIFVEGNKGLESEITSPNSLTDNSVTQSSSQIVTIQSPNGFCERLESCCVSTISSACSLISEVQEGTSVRKEVGDSEKPDGESGLLSFLASEISEEEHLLFGDLDGFALTEMKNLGFASQKEEEGDFWLSPNENEGESMSSPKYGSSLSPDNSHIEDTRSNANDGIRKLTMKSDLDLSTDNKVQPKEIPCMVRSLPNMWPLDDSIANDHGHSLDDSLDSIAERSERLLPSGKSGSDDGQSTLAQQATHDSVIIEKLDDRQTNPSGDFPSESVDASGGGWKIWPFPSKRPGCRDVPKPVSNCNVRSDAENISKSPSSKDELIDVHKIKIVKKKIIKLTPTSEQLATLNLKEGRNSVTFTFSTAMLGQQQVDAQIYLWRWDTHIVISDVDGTITRSDVLGQFMPLVGVDWTQTGVAHLFSAIKENGYELLFLSARSISQAYITRQFLFNLKQDGKTLPDGPVVISPDGLFPSLFREVVRRAPHEFKIACLEEIKALFPSDRNPFYAGFGNRDTDELSYVKVGIPKGKIFIINPKGEIAVNRHINTAKSYTSLHTLVHRMFPPPTVIEQEDFNTWNFWKLPPPAIR